MTPPSDNELFDPPQRVCEAAAYRIFKPGLIIHMPNSNKTWEIGPAQQERARTHGEKLFGRATGVCALCTLCVATQVEGPFLGQKAVAKFKIQYERTRPFFTIP